MRGGVLQKTPVRWSRKRRRSVRGSLPKNDSARLSDEPYFCVNTKLEAVRWARQFGAGLLRGVHRQFGADLLRGVHRVVVEDHADQRPHRVDAVALK